MARLTHTAALQIQHAVPASRFQTYLDQSSDVAHAAQLYLWNIQASSAVTELTGTVEILLRDTIDKKLRIWNAEECGTEEWISRPAVDTDLSHVVRKRPGPHQRPDRQTGLYRHWLEHSAVCNYAVPRPGSPASQSSTPPTHDDLVASLSFGSWTSLLPDPNAGESNQRLHLWNEALSAGFTNVRREAVYNYAHELRWMRNRASHLRPMLRTGDLVRTHRFAIRLLRSIDPDFAQIIAGQAAIPNVIQARP